MKNVFFKAAVMMASLALVAGAQAFAEEASQHEAGAHKPETMSSTMANRGTGKARAEKMKMEMGQMKDMMSSCMSEKQDGKSCSMDTSDKCQKVMGHSQKECAKMMKKMGGLPATK